SLPCRPLTQIEHTRQLTSPLEEELNRLASDQDSSWKKRADNLYLIRHNRWYRQDALEVPAPLLQKWVSHLPGAPVKPADKERSPNELLRSQVEWEAEVAATLTPWQIIWGLTWAVCDKNSLPENFDISTLLTRFPFSFGP